MAQDQGSLGLCEQGHKESSHQSSSSQVQGL